MAGEDDALSQFIAWVRPAWHADAACREHPQLSWFVQPGESYAVQRSVCCRCLVKAECAAAGATEDAGMWGGLSRTEHRHVSAA